MNSHGLHRRLGTAAALAGLALPAISQGFSHGTGHQSDSGPFERIATFPVFENTDVDLETVAEIVAASSDGNTLIYTDSETENLGFVDISDPHDPQPDGVVALGGEPTSVAVRGNYALTCINTSADFVNTSGDLIIVDITTRQIVRTLPLGGQPDAIAVSPNGRFAAVCIENERDEDLPPDGEPPQLPAGFVVIVDMPGNEVETWSTRTVDLTGVCDLFPEDPEPEFVDINAANLAVVTCQENNHIVVIRLTNGQIVADFPAGTVDLEAVDTVEDDLITQASSLQAVPREPDAVTWTSAFTFATADEGDLFGGSRGFTTWSVGGFPLYQAGNTLEHEVARLGHYPEGRSENKGNEPEGAEYGRYGFRNYLFIGSERSSVVFVYELARAPILGNRFPVLRQVLPCGVAPEGLLAIPQRNLFVVACEDDARDDKIRSSLMIYERTFTPDYPTIVSENIQGEEVPIPWAALSGLVTEPNDDTVAYTVHDSFYKQSRVYEVRVDETPAVIERDAVLVDSNGVLEGALNALKASLPASAIADFDVSAVVNGDGTVNLDPEGITVDQNGDFWVASEGRGNLLNGVSDPNDRPFEFPNAIVRGRLQGGEIVIQDAVFPPQSVTENQLRFGFEGCAAVGEGVYVAFQRRWASAGDLPGHVRIGRYDTTTQTWGFCFYPLDTPTSPAGGWVGLSEITHVGGSEFAILERDNQGGTDARIKRVYTVSVAGVRFQPAGSEASFDILTKTLVKDLVADDTFAPTGGPIPEKLEGLSVDSAGNVLIVNDNDGVDDNSGETQLIRLEGLLD